MIQTNLVKKAYKLSHENTEDVQVNRDNIEKLKIQISNIHTHSHSNKSVLDQTTASFLTSEKQKLSTISSGANKNVQANWQETDRSQDSFIQNKPTIPSKTSEIQNDSGFITENDLPVIDNALSLQSENAVQNKVITQAINNQTQAWINGVNSISMVPDDYNIVITTAPTADLYLFTAPSNGVAYLRYSVIGTGRIGFHLKDGTYLYDLSFNTQNWNDGGVHIYNAVFPMKMGQKIYCYENSLINDWGQIHFIPSKEL